MKKKLSSVRKKILKNTENVYLRKELEELILNGNCMSEDDIYKVFRKICEDGYDISDFGLIEIPHHNVYCFGSNDNEKYFDVYLNYFNGGDEEVTVGFWNEDSDNEDAGSIAEAIKKFFVPE